MSSTENRPMLTRSYLMQTLENFEEGKDLAIPSSLSNYAIMKACLKANSVTHTNVY